MPEEIGLFANEIGIFSNGISIDSKCRIVQM